MARRNGSSGLGYLGVGVVTIAAGAAIGYYVIGGVHPQRPVAPAPGIQEVAAPPTPRPAVTKKRHRATPVVTDSDYTAPGAPRIHIVEDQSPTVGSPSGRPPAPHAAAGSSTTDIPTPDAEASQEAATNSAAPSAPPASPTVAASTPGGSSDAAPSASTAATPPEGVTPGPSDTSAPSDAAPSGDTEASQTGASPGTSSPKPHAQYRIQAGSFSNPQDAQSLVNTLQGKGVGAAVSAQQKNGQTIYNVQVGAYRDHGSAEQAATGFRRQGVPVSVAPITP